jgi:hypothetical protein
MRRGNGQRIARGGFLFLTEGAVAFRPPRGWRNGDGLYRLRKKAEFSANCLKTSIKG